MGNCYYLVSPEGQRVLYTSKRMPVIDGSRVSFPVCFGPDFSRDYTPCLATAANVWLEHYGGKGMWVECDAAFSWELDYRGGPMPDWCSYPEDDLFKLRDWLFGRDKNAAVLRVINGGEG